MDCFAIGLTRTRFGFLLIALVCWTFFQGCSGARENEPNSQTSNKPLAFQIQWPQRHASQAVPHAMTGNVCEDFMIETVLASLYAADDTLIKTAKWECVDRTGIMDAPYGSGYRVVIQGVVADNSLWQGEATDIEVVEGVPNAPITIQMAYIGDDSAAPFVLHVSPADATADVSVVNSLTVVLSEPIVKGSMDESNFTLTSDAGPHACDIIYEAGNQSVSIAPRGKLASETTYRAYIAVGGATNVQDLAGNPMTAAFEWTFTTGLDTTTAPVIQYVSPGSDTTVVSLMPRIRAVFDQPMDNQTIVATNMILYDSASNAVAGEVTYEPSENAAVITPTAPLQLNSAYTVTITANVANADGVPMGADYTWGFVTTGSNLGMVQPLDGAITPCDNIPFEWSEVTGATGYHLQVASDSAFQQLLADVMVTATQYQLAHAAVGANYWRVRAQDAAQNQGAWSAVWQFNAIRTLWSQRFGSPGEDDPNGLAITPDDGIVITGRTWGVIDLPGSTDTYAYQGGQGDIFLLKLDAQGNGVWLENLGSIEADESKAVTVDDLGDIYITGFSDGDFGSKQTADSQILISKFSSNGNMRWTRQFGESRSEFGEGIATHIQDDAVQVFVTGYTDMALPDIDPSGDNLFLAQYDAAGTQVSWMHTGTDSVDRGHSVVLCSSGDRIVIGGENRHLVAISFAPDGKRNWTADYGEVTWSYPYMRGAIKGDDLYVAATQVEPATSERKTFVSKINALDGQVAWTHYYEITDDAYYEYGEDIAVDPNGDIYVTGLYYVDTDTAAVYVAKFEPQNGDLRWIETWGGGADPLKYGFPDIAADSQGNVIVTAYSFETYDVWNSYDIFVWKLTGRDQ